ncbi:MAG: UpxY family transcription antiterminator [Bacteroidales bacterium]|nr:UpxY family transcription antiterminator [Bacteroidales bacterium]MDD4210116.1 UpxY family transcription antiterminator [Bacteroidales bacterium]
MEENNLYWFAAKTKPRQEKFIKGQLSELGVTNFIPLRTELRQWKYRKKKVIVPVIPHLVFIRSNFKSCFDIPNVHNVRIWYVKDFVSKRNIIVPDKQMEDFMFLLTNNTGNVNVVNPNLSKGDRVVVTKGPLKGIEGELIRVENKSKVVFNLSGIVALSVEIEGHCLDKVNRN